MPVRQSYQMSAPSGNDGGVIMGDPVDYKFFNVGNTVKRWGLDSDFSGRLRLGGSVAGPGAASLPVVPYGGFGLPRRSVGTGAQTVTIDDCVIRCSGAGANTILNLFSAASFPDSILYIQKDYDGNSVTVEPAGVETISGEPNHSFTSYRQWMVIQSDGANWQIIQYPPQFLELLRSYDPAGATNTGALATIATSPSTFFWGRPTLFHLNISMRNVQGADAFHLVNFSLQIDAGAPISVCDWSNDKANNHQAVGGTVIITPTQGVHTVSIRWQRISGAGTSTINADDFYTLTAIQL
jgi:hypothetical protein